MSWLIRPERWMQYALLAAAAYNITWGTTVVLFPQFSFALAGMAQPNYPELWQCIGMIVGVYGVGFGIAAQDPYRHWPLVFVGFLGKLFGPIGFLQAASDGRLPWRLGWTIVTNDLIWWIPFALILLGARKRHLGFLRIAAPEVLRFALRARTSKGDSLDAMSRESVVLVVFLRHLGCPFCRETLADLARQRQQIENTGAQLVLVHMDTEENAHELFLKFRLHGVPRIRDEKQSLYRAFGLHRGTLWQTIGLPVYWRVIHKGVIFNNGFGGISGDWLQMPGLFLLYHGEVLRSYRHQSIADRPDYLKIVSGDASNPLGIVP